MMEGAARVLRDAASDDAVRAILIMGSGEKVFCAGVDVREQPADGDMDAHRKRRSAALSALLNGVLDTPKPVIAVLNGIASGGGGMLALVADARVAVDSAELSIPEINLGMPTFPGAAIVTQVGGLALAADLVQTGRRMPAAEALARGLLMSVVPRAELEQEAMRVHAAVGGLLSHVHARAKNFLARAHDEDRAHGIVRRGVAQHSSRAFHHAGGERVRFFRALEAQPQQALAPVDREMFGSVHAALNKWGQSNILHPTIMLL
jgi:enoyl-CoA hydratase/carnithine racemase